VRRLTGADDIPADYLSCRDRGATGPPQLVAELGPDVTAALGHQVEPPRLLRAIDSAARTAGAGNEELAARPDGVGVHTLRHSAAVDWLNSGVHIKAVADFSATTPSASAEASTGTPPTTPHAPPLTAGRHDGLRNPRWRTHPSGIWVQCRQNLL
jgi:hypothetical protein